MPPSGCEREVYTHQGASLRVVYVQHVPGLYLRVVYMQGVYRVYASLPTRVCLPPYLPGMYTLPHPGYTTVYTVLDVSIACTLVYVGE